MKYTALIQYPDQDVFVDHLDTASAKHAAQEALNRAFKISGIKVRVLAVFRGHWDNLISPNSKSRPDASHHSSAREEHGSGQD